MTPRITVVVCTHDRAALLAAVVDAAVAQARDVGGEILVVDNASTDDTPATLATLAHRHGEVLQTVREPELGLSAARNRSLATARAPLAAFLDDDALPHPGWLAALAAPFRRTDVAAVGGPIALAIAGPRPAWLVPPLGVLYGEHDLGPASRLYGDGEYPQGGNFAVRIDAACAAGGFSREVGLRGDVRLGHEETDLCCRLRRAGHALWYAADAVVDHQVAADRLTPAWVLARAEATGRSGAIFVLRNFGLRRAIGWLRWHHAPHLRRPAPDDLRAAFHHAEAVGYARGLLAALPHLRRLRRDAAVDPRRAP